MSNTYREHLQVDFITDFKTYYYNTRDGYKRKSGTLKHKKMRPYSSDISSPKYKRKANFNGSYCNTGYDHKESIKNANRSRKKAYRQILKNDLRNQLNELNSFDEN